MMFTFAIASDFDVILAALFRPEKSGRLALGWIGRSIHPTTSADLLVAAVDFRDNVMEGFVKFRVQIKREAPGMILVIETTGTNRDQYVPPQIRSYIQQAGLELSVQDDAHMNFETELARIRAIDWLAIGTCIDEDHSLLANEFLENAAAILTDADVDSPNPHFEPAIVCGER
ncbi:MAG: hypothetical protein N2C14_15020, partial [Planctomycetales bacterium]